MQKYDEGSELEQSLLLPPVQDFHPNDKSNSDDSGGSLPEKVWNESKQLWRIVGPTLMSWICSGTMNIVTQAFAGHLGDLQFAALSIANNVIVGFNFGLLLGMASALETLCGQAFGAKRYSMLGIYMQRSWIILFLCCFLLLPLYAFATPILLLLGQPDDVARESGTVAFWLIPLHFSFAFIFPLQRFLQSQLKTTAMMWISVAAAAVHFILTWILVSKVHMGVIGVALALDAAWWVMVLGMFAYVALGGCPTTWTGFSREAFSGLGEFMKLSASSGVMLCLENWYYRIVILMTGFFNNAKIDVDALSICIAINSWQLMVALSFFAATGVRVANELGAGNGHAAKFATQVSVFQSTFIGLVFFVIVLMFGGKLALLFSDSIPVIQAVEKLSFLLAVSILLNSMQTVLSGVAVGSGWQSSVAWINIICYYVVGVPLGALLGLGLKWGTVGVWGGMIFGGTATQTLILSILTIRTNWEVEVGKTRTRTTKWAGYQTESSK